MFYHCATGAPTENYLICLRGQLKAVSSWKARSCCKLYFLPFSLLPIPAVGFEPSILGLWFEFSTTVLLVHLLKTTWFAWKGSTRLYHTLSTDYYILIRYIIIYYIIIKLLIMENHSSRDHKRNPNSVLLFECSTTVLQDTALNVLYLHIPWSCTGTRWGWLPSVGTSFWCPGGSGIKLFFICHWCTGKSKRMRLSLLYILGVVFN